jgi:DNA-binding HxlR family transcriptional regulator
MEILNPLDEQDSRDDALPSRSQSVSGVERQAGTIPKEVRTAIAALDSDVSFAILATIEQSGTTRFSWLRQETHLDNQEIVETLGQLYAADLLSRTTTGKNEGRESAYEITPLGERVLAALRSVSVDDTEDVDDTDTETTPRRKMPAKTLAIFDPL